MPIFTQQQKSTRQTKSATAKPYTRGFSHEPMHLRLPQPTGNRAVQHTKGHQADSAITPATNFAYAFAQFPILSPAPVQLQAKLTVNAPGDIDEQTADRVADQVLRNPAPQHGNYGGEGPKDQLGQASHNRSPNGGQGNNAGELAPPLVSEVLGSSGQPLDLHTRAFFEPRFGFDFSRVRIHQDQQAATSARGVGAHAYTVANHIVFGTNRSALEQPEQNHLLAHELTHVIQQQATQSPRLQRDKTGDDKENKARAKILATFTDGANLSEQRVSQIEAAMRAFSLHQLQALQQAGVRFWAPDSLPPEFKDRVKVDNLSTPGEYLDIIHVIRIARNATTDAIRHELAHAWDHVRTGKVKPVGQLNDKAFEKAVNNTPALSSTTDEKRATKETQAGKVSGVRLTIGEMLARYKQWSLREQSFDNPSTREGYSKQSPREFYAEGYSVFHGGREWNQARLLYYAPELYALLEAEAKQQGLAVPDRAKIQAALKEQKLQ